MPPSPRNGSAVGNSNMDTEGLGLKLAPRGLLLGLTTEVSEPELAADLDK